MKRLSFLIGVIIVIIVSFWTILPLFSPGFISMHDDTQVPRVYEMTKALKMGQFPVRWVEDLGYGYGYPIFNFYAPLPYYIGSFWNLLGFDVITSTKIMFGIGTLLAGITMFMTTRIFLGISAGIVSAIIYVYFPYHAVNIYVRGAVGEFFAYAFLPLVFLGIFGLFKQEKKEIRWTIILSLGLALVILSHNLSAFMLGLILIPLIAGLTFFAKSRKVFLLSVCISGALALCLTAFYVIPAILEAKYTNVASQVGGGADFKDHFICAQQFWNSNWGFGGSTPTCTDGLSFKLGKTNIFFVLTGIILFVYLCLKKQKDTRAFLVASSIGILVLSLFLTLEYSRFIWELVPSIEFIQYPWRFLNFVGLSMAIIIGYLIFSTEKKYNFLTVGLAALIILVTLFYSAKLFEPQTYYKDRSSSFYTNEDYIRWEVSKISDEYMPPHFNKPKSEDEIPTKLLEKQSDGRFKVKRAYFPNMEVRINGRQVEYQVENGNMFISIDPGEQSVEFVKKQSRIQMVGNVISLAGILIALSCITIFVSRRTLHFPRFTQKK